MEAFKLVDIFSSPLTCNIFLLRKKSITFANLQVTFSSDVWAVSFADDIFMCLMKKSLSSIINARFITICDIQPRYIRMLITRITDESRPQSRHAKEISSSFSNISGRLLEPNSLFSMITGESFTEEQSERGFKLTAHLPIITKSKKCPVMLQLSYLFSWHDA